MDALDGLEAPRPGAHSNDAPNPALRTAEFSVEFKEIGPLGIVWCQGFARDGSEMAVLQVSRGAGPHTCAFSSLAGEPNIVFLVPSLCLPRSSDKHVSSSSPQAIRADSAASRHGHIHPGQALTCVGGTSVRGCRYFEVRPATSFERALLLQLLCFFALAALLLACRRCYLCAAGVPGQHLSSY